MWNISPQRGAWTGTRWFLNCGGKFKILMSETSARSVTEWILELKSGDVEAAERLFERYFDQLVQLARTQLPGDRRRVSDEEDVAQTTFTSLVLDVSNGRHLQLTDRHDLWSLLIAITKHKAADMIKSELREKRGGGQIHDESMINRQMPEGRGAIAGEDSDGSWQLGLADIIDQTPTVDDLAEYNDRLQTLLHRLDRADPSGDLRQVAILKISGHTNEEVAKKLGRVARTVVRKLERIRKIWLKE